MQKNTLSILYTSLILLFFTLQGCDEGKPEISAKDHLDLAQLYFKQGSFQASIIEGKNALQKEPKNIDVLSTMATVLIKLNDGRSAEELIKTALEIEKDNQNLKLLLVKAYFQQGKLFSATSTFETIDINKIEEKSQYQTQKADFLFNTNKKEAKSWYIKAYNTDNKNMDAILGAAKASLALQQIDDVDKFSALALETSPSDIEALIWQARVYMLKKQYVDAENILSRAMIELERYDTLTANKYTAIDLLAKALVAQGKIEESFTYSNYLAKTRQGKFKSSYDNAINLISSGKDITEAESAFQDVLKQVPEHKSSNIMLGMINYEKGDYTQAEDYLGKFASDESTPLRSKKTLALTKIKLNKQDEAIKLIQENLKLHKNDADLYALLGFAHLKNNNPDKSIEALNKAISISGTSSLYYTQLAKAYLNKKDFKLAIKNAEQALKIKPNSDQAKQVLVTAHFIKNDLKKAKQITQQWLKESPKNLTALYISASLAQKTNNRNKARTQFLKILAIDPYHLAANINLAKYDTEDKKIDKAYDRLKLVLVKQPENMTVLSTMYQTTLAAKATTDKAIEILSAVITKNPNTINSRLLLAQLYLNNKQPEETISTVNKIIALDAKNGKAYLFKAKALLAQNNSTDAIATYQSLTTVLPNNPSGPTQLSALYYKQENYKQSIQEATKAISIKNDHVPAHIILFNSALHINNKNLAMKSVNALRQQMPDSPLPDELEADYYLSVKDYPTAIDKLQAAWKKQHSIALANKLMLAYKETSNTDKIFSAWDEIAKNNTNNFQLQASYSLVLQKEGYFKKAKSVVESQLKTFPKSSVLLNNLANIYMETNDDRAIEVAKKALAIQPNNPAIQDTVGWIYTEQHKDYKQGIPYLEKAFQATNDTQIKNHLIKALTLAGRKEEASKISSAD